MSTPWWASSYAGRAPAARRVSVGPASPLPLAIPRPAIGERGFARPASRAELTRVAFLACGAAILVTLGAASWTEAVPRLVRGLALAAALVAAGLLLRALGAR